jgi:hypothetical protein
VYTVTAPPANSLFVHGDCTGIRLPEFAVAGLPNHRLATYTAPDRP